MSSFDVAVTGCVAAGRHARYLLPCCTLRCPHAEAPQRLQKAAGGGAKGERETEKKKKKPCRNMKKEKKDKKNKKKTR